MTFLGVPSGGHSAIQSEWRSVSGRLSTSGAFEGGVVDPRADVVIGEADRPREVLQIFERPRRRHRRAVRPAKAVPPRGLKLLRGLRPRRVELGDPGANERAIGLLSEELVDQRVEAVRHDPVFVMRGRLSRHLLIRSFRGTAKFRRAAALARPRSRQTTMVCCAERPRYEPVLLTPVR